MFHALRFTPYEFILQVFVTVCIASTHKIQGQLRNAILLSCYSSILRNLEFYF